MPHLCVISGDTRHPPGQATTLSSLSSLLVLARRSFAVTAIAASLAACGGLLDDSPSSSAAATNTAAADSDTDAATAGTVVDTNEAAARARRFAGSTNTSNGTSGSSTSTGSTSTGSTSGSSTSGSGASTGSTVSTSSSSTATTSTNVTSSSAVETIISDMKLFHDGPAGVLEALPGWGSGASWPEATVRPSGWQYAIPWTHVIADTSSANGNGYPWRVLGPYTGNQAPNTRVQQRDVQMWWLLSNGSWVLGSHNNSMEPVMYPYAWAESTEVRGQDIWRDESGNGGGVSMRAIGRENYAKRLWHTWAAPHRIPDNAVGAVSVFFARKILDNPAGTDDRNQARLMAAGAGDWYRDQATLTSAKVQGSNVIYMGFSRLKYVTNDWQLFGWTSLSEGQLRSNPPPLIGL